MDNQNTALQLYFEKFGIPAYPVTSVPEEAEFPYLTYEPMNGKWGDGQYSITVNLYARTPSEAVINEIVERIGNDLGIGGKMITWGDGGMIIHRGSPFAQPLSYGEDRTIKRRYINITAENLS